MSAVISIGNLRYILALLLATIGSGAFSFLTQALLARALPKNLYGELNATLVVINMLVPLSLFGLPQFLQKLNGESPLNSPSIYKRAISKTIVSSTLCSSLFIVYMVFLDSSLGQYYYLFIIIFLFFMLGRIGLELRSVSYQLSGAYYSLSRNQITFNGLILALSALLYVLKERFLIFKPVHELVLLTSYFITGFIYCFLMVKAIDVIGGIFKEKDVVGVGVKFKKNDCPQKGVARNMAPFMVASLLHLIYFQSNVLVIRHFSGPSSVADYSVAFWFLMLCYMFPAVIYQKFLLPKMHVWAYHEEKLLIKSFKIGSALMALIGSVLAIVIFYSSEFFVVLIFGEDFKYSAVVLSILCFAIPLRFVSSASGAILSTGDNIRRKVRLMSVVAAVNVPLTVLFFKFFGLTGVAYATVLSEFLLCLIFYFSVKRNIYGSSNVKVQS